MTATYFGLKEKTVEILLYFFVVMSSCDGITTGGQYCRLTARQAQFAKKNLRVLMIIRFIGQC